MKRIAKSFTWAIFSGIALTVLLAACGNNAMEERASDLEVSVMEIHDKAMGQMGQVSYLIDTLTSLLNQAEVNDSLPDTMRVVQLKNCISQLHETDEAMMNWMHNYNPPSDEMDVSDKIKYLKSEKEKVEAVQKLFESSIPAGKECLAGAKKQ